MGAVTAAAGAAPARRPGGMEYKWVVLTNTPIGILMASLDSSILTIALPDITRELHATVVDVMWVVMGFQLVITALLLPFARLADMKGRVRPYNLGFALFTLSSVLCGLAMSGTQLVVFRLLQGIGAAFIFSNRSALITDAFPDEERGFALGINMMAGMTGFILGTVLGGVITEFLGWRYIFFLNIPFGVFATTWAFLRLRETSERDGKARFDVGGMITFPLAITSILAALTFVVMGRAGENITDGLFVAGIVLFIVFALIERRVPHPMMDASLFRIRLFLAGNASLLLNALARGSTSFIMSWYFQAVLQNSPLRAGLKMLPLVSTMMLCAPIAGRLSDRFGSRWLSTIGLAFTGIGQIWMMTVPLHASYPRIAVGLAILGTGNGLFNSPNTSAVMGSVPRNRRGVAAGMRTLLNNTGQTTAIAAAMVILSTVMSYQLLTGLFTGRATGQALDPNSFMRGFHEIFFFGAITCVIAIVCSSLRGSDEMAIRAAVTPEIGEPLTRASDLPRGKRA
jgi:EmrB/QacA subfamily drug resistance transporter